MPLYKPLNLPWKHSVHEGIPVPIFITTERYKEIQEKHKSRPDDVFIATYQRSGTTWLQHIVNQLYDEPQGKGLILPKASPWLEASAQSDIDNMASPRIFKTHDKWRWIPKADSVKYIYCYRNPKDTAVSEFFQKVRVKSGFEGTIDEYMSELFLKKNASANGWYFDHVAEWLEQKNNKDILFLTYEDMVEDLNREVKKIITFLNCIVDEEKVKRIVEGSSFDAMKENDLVNFSWGKFNADIEERISKGETNVTKFMRKGKVGDWVNYLSEKHSKEVEELVNKHLIPVGAKIRYTLEYESSKHFCRRHIWVIYEKFALSMFDY